MSFHVITCSQCAFRSASHITWGRYYYRLRDDTEISLERQLGWCHQCDDIEPIEDLSSAQAFVEFETAANRLTTLNAPGPWPALKRLFKSVRNKICYLLRLRGETGRYLAMLRTRQAPSRCLTCGATSVKPLPPIPVREGELEFYFDDYADPLPPLPFGFSHPGCPGELLAQPSGVRIFPSLKKKVYSPEGLLLQTGEIEVPDFRQSW